ncbi:MAG TPA: tetratricopeptide repeat protein, partial [Candidatus Binataceae bacterium]|nr:tetratricopeptide repeat protein [Candidatus Binataceae bacterium]
MRNQSFILAWFASLSLALLIPNRAVCLTSQDVPAAELPGAGASPSIGTSPSPASSPSPGNLEPQSQENQIAPEPSADVTGQDDTGGDDSVNDNSESNDSGNLQTNQQTSAPESQPSPDNAIPPALDAGAMTIGPELGSQSLDGEIKKAIVPAMAASLRLTESARLRLGDGHIDNALRDLARAVSLDPSDAFAYYYLGRAYLAKKNYTQALTFFRRAEIGFNGRPDWTAEALSYEGLCDEELGKATDAAQAYKQALAASPNNFRAR